MAASNNNQNQDPKMDSNIDETSEKEVVHSRFGEVKNILNWTSRFYEKHTVFSLILILLGSLYLGFRTFGLTPLRSVNSMINHGTNARRWTKLCSYHILAPEGIDEKYTEPDVSDIISDVVLDSCDFYHVKGRLSDSMQKLILDSKVIITTSEQ